MFGYNAGEGGPGGRGGAAGRVVTRDVASALDLEARKRDTANLGALTLARNPSRTMDAMDSIRVWGQ